MVDPSRLLVSAKRLYGDELDRLWGEMVPVPEQNLRVVDDGDRVLEGRFQVAYTPGHASHHVSYLHEGTAFVGDVGGVRIQGATLTIPPTPPPDIDVEAWHRSIELLAGWAPERLAMTHFGESTDVEAHLDELGERLDAWVALVRDHGEEAFLAHVRAEIERGAGPELVPAYTLAAEPEQMYPGLERYLRKRAEAEGSAGAGERGSAGAGERGSAAAGDRGSAAAGDRGSAQPAQSRAEVS
jgi:glyoxylase-like metal-dependent hydrolase (beta-lactamase superfamily II)